MNRLRVIYSSILFIFLFSFSISGQSEFTKGVIQINKKKSIDAYISIDYTFPQRFQNSLTYITPKDYQSYQEKGKLKNKKKIKLNLKDFHGFTLVNGQKFTVVKYVDLTKKGIGMLPKRICLEQIAEGKIDAFKMYSRTTGKISIELADVVMDSKIKGDQLLIDYIKDNFQLLVQKESKTPKNIMHINLLNYISDNEDVKNNYDNNRCGFRNQFSERQKFGVIVNKKYQTAFLKMINDYNGKSIDLVKN